jgi:hypothetical protein
VTPTFDNFNQSWQHINHLLDRRQKTTSFYLSVNTGIIAVISFLMSGQPFTGVWMPVSFLLVLVAGLVACWIWRSLLYQYEIQLDWWYKQLRELEAEMEDSARLITREYEELYLARKDYPPAKRLGMTERELALNWLFTVLYAAFGLGILLDMIL